MWFFFFKFIYTAEDWLEKCNRHRNAYYYYKRKREQQKCACHKAVPDVTPVDMFENLAQEYIEKK